MRRNKGGALVLDPTFAMDRIRATSEREHNLVKSDELKRTTFQHHHNAYVSCLTLGALLCA